MSERPDTARVVRRARVLAMVLQRGFGALYGAAGADAPFDEAWLREVFPDEDDISAEEWAMLTAPPDVFADMANEATWACEPLSILSWALGLGAMPPQDSDIAPFAVLNAVQDTILADSDGEGAVEVDNFKTRRGDEALMRALWSWFWVHRRVTRMIAHPGAHDLEAEIAAHPTSPPVHDAGADGLLLVAGDMEVWEQPIGALSVAHDLPYGADFARVTALRLRAMRWLCGVARRYDDATPNVHDPHLVGASAHALMYDRALDDATVIARGGHRTHAYAWRGDIPALLAALDDANLYEVDPRNTPRDVLGDTVMHAAARGAAPESVRALIARGCSCDLVGARGVTPLHVAARSGDMSTLNAMLRAPGDRDALDHDVQTPLMCAIHARWHDGVRAILDAGVYHNGFKQVDPPIFCAIATRELSLVTLFLERGVELERRNGGQQTPLLFAMAQDAPNIARAILDAGAQLDVQDMRGQSALHWAATCGDVHLVERALTTCAVDAQTETGFTALALALHRGHDAAARLLLSHGADPDTPDTRGRAALHHALSAALLDMVTLLLIAGATPGLQDHAGATPLHALAANAPEDAASVHEVVRALHEAGADLDTRDHAGVAPLHLAANAGHVSAVRALLDAGADRDASTPEGFQPIHCAAMGYGVAVIPLLHDAGADLDAPGPGGQAPLHLAVLADVENVSALLRAGARIDLTDDDGRTPLALASAHALDGARALLASHADRSV